MGRYIPILRGRCTGGLAKARMFHSLVPAVELQASASIRPSMQGSGLLAVHGSNSGRTRITTTKYPLEPMTARCFVLLASGSASLNLLPVLALSVLPGPPGPSLLPSCPPDHEPSLRPAIALRRVSFVTRRSPFSCPSLLLAAHAPQPYPILPLSTLADLNLPSWVSRTLQTRPGPTTYSCKWIPRLPIMTAAVTSTSLASKPLVT